MEAMMRKKKNAVDVSSLFYFEASGDSEAADNNNFNDPNYVAAAIDDDAESCSCDLSYDDFPVVTTTDQHHVNGSCVSRSSCTVVNVEEDEEEEEEGEEAHSYSRYCYSSCQNNNINKKKNHKIKKKKKKKKKNNNGVLEIREDKSSVSVDLSQESMSEEEKNRLFWEACLAS